VGGGDREIGERDGYINTIPRRLAAHNTRTHGRRRMANAHWAPVLLGGRSHRRGRRRRSSMVVLVVVV